MKCTVDLLRRAALPFRAHARVLQTLELKLHLNLHCREVELFDASKEQKKEFAAWLETVRDAAEPDADGVAAVHMDVEQMEVDEEGGEQRERDEQVEGDEGVRMRMRMKRGMSDKWEKGNFYFKGDLWKGLDAANETECC